MWSFLGLSCIIIIKGVLKIKSYIRRRRDLMQKLQGTRTVGEEEELSGEEGVHLPQILIRTT